MYVYLLCMYLVPTEARRGYQNLLKLKLLVIVSDLC